MFKQTIMVLLLVLPNLLAASTKEQMGRGFDGLMKLVPYLSDQKKFTEEKKASEISNGIRGLEKAFSQSKHDQTLQQDIFKPSLELIRNDLRTSKAAFEFGHKDYAFDKLKNITAQCIACHTRLPDEKSSSYQDGLNQIELSKFDNYYDLGIGQMIVRKYVDAKNSFTRVLDDAVLKKEFESIMAPLRQILLIEVKVKHDPEAMITLVEYYRTKQGLRLENKQTLSHWLERLKVWTTKKGWVKNGGLKSDQDVNQLIKETLEPMDRSNTSNDGEIDLLMASGLLSQFSFAHPSTELAPDILYWLGHIETLLKEKGYFSSGEYFLKECVLRYPQSKVAPKCLEEYKASLLSTRPQKKSARVEKEVQDELEALTKLITPKKDPKK